MTTSAHRRFRVRHAVVGLALLVPLSGGLLAGQAANSAQAVEHAPLLPAASQHGNRADKPAEAGKALNIVVVRQQGDSAAEIALVHVNADRSRVDVVALPTSTKVDGQESDLGSTYASEGMPGLVRAVEGLTQVSVDHAAEVNAQGVEAAEDLAHFSNPLSAPGKINAFLRNVTVDEGLSMGEMRKLAWQLVDTGKPHMHAFTPSETEQLRSALQSDSLASY